MIKGAIATILLIVVLTAWVQRVHGETPTRAKFVIPLWGLGGAFVVAVSVTVWWFSATRDYDACMARVERSRGSRVQTVQLFDTIDEATHTTHYTSDVLIPGHPSLRDALDVNLPELNPGVCAPLKP